MSNQHYLVRKQLDQAFENILHYPLTVVVAAMGYGKSTAIKAFLKRSVKYSMYLTFEGEEISYQYIWSMLTRQLAKTYPVLGEKLNALGYPSNSSQFDHVKEILIEAIGDKTVVMIVDDYHFCHSDQFDQLVKRFIRSDIPGLHTVIVSRTMPEIDIQELLLKDYAYQIPSYLFEMSKQDIDTYFKLYNYELTGELIQTVYDASEGWISGVYLMLQHYSETKCIRTGWHIERLIDSSVSVRYSSEEIKLLKTLCFLETIAPEQAIAVSGNQKAAHIIERLSNGNAFIRYDEEAKIYRIHNIFNSYLRKKCIEEPLVDSNQLIYKRAGEWCLKTGDVLMGLSYLLKAEAYETILTEFKKIHFTKIIDNNPTFIINLFSNIPKKQLLSHPMAYLGFVGFYVTNVDALSGIQLLDEITQYTLSTAALETAIKNRIFGEVELIRGYLSFNDVIKMHERFKSAHTMLGGISEVTNHNKIITFGAPSFLYMYYTTPGKFEWTKKWVHKLFYYYTDLARGCGKGADYLLNAEVYIEGGQFEAAEVQANKAICRASSLDQTSIILNGKFILARAALGRGDILKAREIAETLYTEIYKLNSPILSSTHALILGYIGGILKDENYFETWLKIGDIESCDVLYQGRGYFYIVYGKYLLLKRDYITLEHICEMMIEDFKVFNQQFLLWYSHLFNAIAKYHLNEWQDAENHLSEAISIARRDNLTLVFIELADDLLPVLKMITLRDEALEFIERIKQVMLDYARMIDDTISPKDILSELTSRERDILTHLVSGKTNKQIGEELFIAEVTVRKNITSIYKKMAVSGRTAAVKLAVELGFK